MRRARGRLRPWRAVAYTVSPFGEVRLEGHTSATTPQGLERFRRAHLAAGHEVQVSRQHSSEDEGVRVVLT